MSLIYDYLKIQGKNGSDVDVEIPPALMRRDSSKPKRPSFLLILGSCLIGVLLLFLVYKIFYPAQNVKIAVHADPPAPLQALPDKPAVTAGVPQKTDVIKEVERRATRQDMVQVIQVFPEPEKSKSVNASSSRSAIAETSSERQEIMGKKPVQPLELESEIMKITFPENMPVYTEPQDSVEKVAAVLSRPTGRSAAADAKNYPSSGVSSGAREKSKKFYQAGLQAQHKGDGRIAEIYYKRALEEAPGHMEAMINLSALYVQQERYHEAEEILAVILAIEPTNSKALLNMGVVSLFQGNESRAEAQFGAALDANPLEENALVNLAYLAEKNRDYAATEMYYRELLQIAPDNLEVLLAYGHLLEEQGRYPEALALYGETLELGPVKKDRRLHSRISDRMRLLDGAVKNARP